MMLPNSFFSNILYDDVSGNRMWLRANFQGEAESALGRPPTWGPGDHVEARPCSRPQWARELSGDAPLLSVRTGSLGKPGK